MPAQLIINADDFGLTPGVNRAIAELASAGVLASATLMARGDALDDAVERAHSLPGLALGCHLVFTDGTPVSDPSQIPSLLGSDGRNFRPSLREFLLAAVSGRIRREHLRLEALAQIRRLQSRGLQLTHADTHKHTHVLPQVAGPVREALVEAGVPGIRNPFEAPWSLVLGHSRPLRLLSVAGTRLLRPGFLRQPAIRSGAVRTTSGTLGISATGRLDAAVLRRLLQAMPSTGVWELVCHPGYNDHALDRVITRLRQTREIERNALLSVLPSISAHPGGPELIHYGRLPTPAPKA